MRVNRRFLHRPVRWSSCPCSEILLWKYGCRVFDEWRRIACRERLRAISIVSLLVERMRAKGRGRVEDVRSMMPTLRVVVSVALRRIRQGGLEAYLGCVRDNRRTCYCQLQTEQALGAVFHCAPAGACSWTRPWGRAEGWQDRTGGSSGEVANESLHKAFGWKKESKLLRARRSERRTALAKLRKSWRVYAAVIIEAKGV